MTRQELFTRIKAIVDEAGTTGDTAPAVAVLYSLLGAMAEGQDTQIMNHCAEYTRDALRGLKAGDN